jgi:hypothetical protein
MRNQLQVALYNFLKSTHIFNHTSAYSVWLQSVAGHTAREKYTQEQTRYEPVLGYDRHF